MSCGNSFDSNMPPFVNTRGTQKAVVSLQAWRPRRFGWECTEREKGLQAWGREQEVVRNCIRFPLLFCQPLSLLPLVVQAGSVWEMREGGVSSPLDEHGSIIMHSTAGFTFNTFLPGLRLVLTMLDLAHNHWTRALCNQQTGRGKVISFAVEFGIYAQSSAECCGEASKGSLEGQRRAQKCLLYQPCLPASLVLKGSLCSSTILLTIV